MEFSVLEVWEKAPMLNKVILASMLVMSVWSIFVMIERGLTFFKGSRQSYSYVLALRDYLSKHQVNEAITAAKRHQKSPVSKVVEAGLVAYKQGLEALEKVGPADVGDFDIVDSVNRSLERVKEREISNLRKGLGGLATIASIAPFVGLLGTVIGIIGAFALLKGGGGFDVIGPAIAEALFATAMGLLVAIPAAMAFNYFTGRVESMVVDMSDVSSEFIDFVLREGRS
jgi:biopolymer transport protein ExbB/TolQ